MARGGAHYSDNSTLSGKTRNYEGNPHLSVRFCVWKEKDGCASEVKDSQHITRLVGLELWGPTGGRIHTPLCNVGDSTQCTNPQITTNFKNMHAYVRNKEEMRVVTVLGSWNQVNFFLFKNLFHVDVSLH